MSIVKQDYGEVGKSDPNIASSANIQSQSSVSITCEVGDIVVIPFRRATDVDLYWNGTLWGSSPDYIASTYLTTNTFCVLFKASQTNNVFSTSASNIAVGAYYVIH